MKLDRWYPIYFLVISNDTFPLNAQLMLILYNLLFHFQL